jgi:hypothetical protein
MDAVTIGILVVPPAVAILIMMLVERARRRRPAPKKRTYEGYPYYPERSPWTIGGSQFGR